MTRSAGIRNGRTGNRYAFRSYLTQLIDVITPGASRGSPRSRDFPLFLPSPERFRMDTQCFRSLANIHYTARC